MTLATLNSRFFAPASRAGDGKEGQSAQSAGCSTQCEDWRLVLHICCSALAFLSTLAYEVLSICSPLPDPAASDYAQGNGGAVGPVGAGAGTPRGPDSAVAAGTRESAETGTGQGQRGGGGRSWVVVGAGGLAAVVLCALPSSVVDLWLLSTQDHDGSGFPAHELRVLWLFSRVLLVVIVMWQSMTRYHATAFTTHRQDGQRHDAPPAGHSSEYTSDISSAQQSTLLSWQGGEGSVAGATQNKESGGGLAHEHAYRVLSTSLPLRVSPRTVGRYSPQVEHQGAIPMRSAFPQNRYSTSHSHAHRHSHLRA